MFFIGQTGASVCLSSSPVNMHSVVRMPCTPIEDVVKCLSTLLPFMTTLLFFSIGLLAVALSLLLAVCDLRSRVVPFLFWVGIVLFFLGGMSYLGGIGTVQSSTAAPTHVR